jgi:hypothetical protein
VQEINSLPQYSITESSTLMISSITGIPVLKLPQTFFCIKSDILVTKDLINMTWNVIVF